MADRLCQKCGATFPYPRDLKRHLARKTPCAPIVEGAELPLTEQAKCHECRYCRRKYSTLPSLHRHMRHRCKIANDEGGMALLMDHTLRQQVDRLEAQMTELSDLVRAQMLTPAATVIQHQTNIGVLQQNTVQVNVVSFDREDRIHIPVALVKAAFTENPRLMEYCRMSDNERVDAEKAAPYVLEALVDLVRRAHRDPVYRNVYLNPKRADQVMVCLDEKGRADTEPLAAAGSRDRPLPRWEARSLVEATRLLFDGVADNLHKIVITDQERAQLPFDVQSAASWVPNLYEDEPERFVKDGRAPMAAHLANTRPSP